jgi:flagellar biosynthetic protein FliP
MSPRQGLAVVRFQDRTLLLSYGEGGIRLITEAEDVDEGDAGQDIDPLLGNASAESLSDPTTVKDQEDISFPQVWNRVRKAAGLGSTALLALAFMGPAAELSGKVPGSLEPTQVAVPTQASPSASTSPAVPTGPAPEGALMDLARRLPSMDLRVGAEEGFSISGPVGTVLFIGFLTLLPTVLLLMTGFTRILVVLHLLKQAMGTQTAPPAHLLAAMALLLTGFVMAPTLTEVNQVALIPWMAGEMDEVEMMKAASVPFRHFMLESTGENELVAFMDMRGGDRPETVDEIPLTVLTSAFVTSELRQAFQIGFALFLPFVVIDIVVASVLMSMGMFMLPPVMVSLPFKLLLFVLVDGWSLIVGGLVQSFA